MNRDFYAEKPNQKSVTDVTEFSLFGQKLYLSPILDLYNGYLVSYTISERPVLSMVTIMLNKAFVVIPDGTRLISIPTRAGNTSPNSTSVYSKLKAAGKV